MREFKMQSRRTALRSMVAAVGAAPLPSACLSGPTYSYRYKLTLDVSVGGVVHSGVSIVEVRWAFPAGPSESQMPNRMTGARVIGEANILDLGDGRAMIALLTRRHENASALGWGETEPTALLCRLFGVTPDTDQMEQQWGIRHGLSELARNRGTRTIIPDELPELIMLPDTSNPRTAAYVDQNDLSASFGGNAHFKSMAIELTNEPVSHLNEKRYPWLLGNGYLDGTRYGGTMPVAGNISMASLRRG